MAKKMKQFCSPDAVNYRGGAGPGRIRLNRAENTGENTGLNEVETLSISGAQVTETTEAITAASAST